MVSVGDSATAGEKELKRNWPNEVGLIAGTTKQEGEKMNLEPESSLVSNKLKKNL